MDTGSRGAEGAAAPPPKQGFLKSILLKMLNTSECVKDPHFESHFINILHEIIVLTLE